MIQWIKGSVYPLFSPHFSLLLNKQDVFTEKNLRLLFLLDHYLRFCNNRYVKELTICELGRKLSRKRRAVEYLFFAG